MQERLPGTPSASLRRLRSSCEFLNFCGYQSQLQGSISKCILLGYSDFGGCKASLEKIERRSNSNYVKQKVKCLALSCLKFQSSLWKVRVIPLPICLLSFLSSASLLLPSKLASSKSHSVPGIAEALPLASVSKVVPMLVSESTAWLCLAWLWSWSTISCLRQRGSFVNVTHLPRSSCLLATAGNKDSQLSSPAFEASANSMKSKTRKECSASLYAQQVIIFILLIKGQQDNSPKAKKCACKAMMSKFEIYLVHRCEFGTAG